MPQQFFHITTVVVILTFAGFGQSQPVLAAGAAPSPPPKVCLDDVKCASTAATVSSASGIKWHPGIYVFPGNYKCDSTARADDFATIDQIANNPNIKGIYFHWEWSCFEGDTPADYSAGFSRIDAYVAKLAPLGKKLMFGLWPMQWGSCTSANSTNGFPNSGYVRLPAYIRNTQGWVSYCTPDQRIYTAALWNSALMDRIIALSAAYAARYDSNPTVEMFEPHEESAGLSGQGAADFSWPVAQSQWDRFYAAAASQWTHTLIRNSLNWAGDNSWIRSEFDNKSRPGIIFGGADSIPESIFQVQANYIFRGLNPGNPANTSGTAHSGWTDLRGTHPWLSEVQGGEIYGSATAQQLQDYAYNTMHMSYAIWMRQRWDGETSRYWATVWPLISTGNAPVYSTACPKSWTCNTK